MTGKRKQKALLLIAFSLLCGCATFKSKPLQPAKTASSFEARTLRSAGLEGFIVKNLKGKKEALPELTWPPGTWDLKLLSLAALYYHPDMDVARARWGVREAGVITAGARPNPGAALTPQYHANPGGLAPWTLMLSLDIPVETAGRRGYRIARARHLSAAARMEIAETAWKVRSRLRKSLLRLFGFTRKELLLKEQYSAQDGIVQIYEQRLAAGQVSGFALTSERIARDKTALALSRAAGGTAQARAGLAESLGIPSSALKGIDISFEGLERVSASLYSADVRREALTGRADVLAKLEEYEAAQSALQLQIARQYPDVRLGPGYSWDQGDNEWSLGLVLELPVLNRNEGPIAEARAGRKQAAAEFTALQARVIGEIDRAFVGYNASLQNLKAADSLVSAQRENLEVTALRVKAGQEDRLALLLATQGLISAELSRLDALLSAQESVGRLEDAVQRPLNDPAAFPRGATPDEANR
jgi:cobalt-zinc-cadmium efflux system outer membrane protein